MSYLSPTVFTYRVSFDVSLRLRLVAFVVNHSFRTVVLFDCNKGALLFSQLINQLHDCCQKCCRGVTLGIRRLLKFMCELKQIAVCSIKGNLNTLKQSDHSLNRNQGICSTKKLRKKQQLSAYCPPHD